MNRLHAPTRTYQIRTHNEPIIGQLLGKGLYRTGTHGSTYRNIGVSLNYPNGYTALNAFKGLLDAKKANLPGRQPKGIPQPLSVPTP